MKRMFDENEIAEIVKSNTSPAKLYMHRINVWFSTSTVPSGDSGKIRNVPFVVYTTSAEPFTSLNDVHTAVFNNTTNYLSSGGEVIYNSDSSEQGKVYSVRLGGSKGYSDIEVNFLPTTHMTSGKISYGYNKIEKCVDYVVEIK